MPFMDEPPGASVSSHAVALYGRVIRNLRRITNHSVNQEPKWRHNRPALTTGYHPTTYA
jgi:hydrogenase small subunit